MTFSEFPPLLVNVFTCRFRTNEQEASLMSCQSGLSRLSVVLSCGGASLYVHQGGLTMQKTISLPKAATDNSWHRLEFKLRKEACAIRVAVDDFKESVSLSTSDAHCILTNGSLSSIVLGSSHDNPHPSRHFAGCVGLLGVNHQLLPFVSEVRQSEAYIQGAIAQGCAGHGDGCSHHGCINSATCHPGWQRYHCDCSNTHFTGKHCDQGVLAWACMVFLRPLISHYFVTAQSHSGAQKDIIIITTNLRYSNR